MGVRERRRPPEKRLGAGAFFSDVTIAGKMPHLFTNQRNAGKQQFTVSEAAGSDCRADVERGRREAPRLGTSGRNERR